MRLIDADHRLARVEFRHRVVLDLVHFDNGVAAWRARCACGWKSSVKTNNVDAAARTAQAHSAGFIMGMPRDVDTLLEPS